MTPSARGRSVRLVKLGRNDPCPCGSGAKVKRCCGVEGIRRSQGAAAQLFSIAFHFPRSRPASPAFDAWAATAPDRLSRGLLEEGGALFEREAPAADFAARYPEVWRGLVAEFRDEPGAIDVVAAGAVVAGLEERQRPLDPRALALLDPDDGAAEALAFVLEPHDLWSVLETAEAVDLLDAGLPIDAAAERLWTDWHESRLDVLVERVRAAADHPVLVRACAEFDRDRRVRRRLRGETLLDALPRVLDAFMAAA